jgi:hypothetical protein
MQNVNFPMNAYCWPGVSPGDEFSSGGVVECWSNAFSLTLLFFVELELWMGHPVSNHPRNNNISPRICASVPLREDWTVYGDPRINRINQMPENGISQNLSVYSVCSFDNDNDSPTLPFNKTHALSAV